MERSSEDRPGASHAHPGGLRHDFVRLMHESPHAFPFLQILQHAICPIPSTRTVAAAGQASGTAA